MRPVVKMESNATNLLAILSITAVPIVVAWPVIFGAGMGPWKVACFVAAGVVAGFWCTAVMSWVAAMES